MVERIQTILEIVGLVASAALPLLARSHSRLATALQAVLDAVHEEGHGPTADAVAQVDHPAVRQHPVSQ